MEAGFASDRAPHFIEKAHDLVAKPLTLWRIMRRTHEHALRLCAAASSASRRMATPARLGRVALGHADADATLQGGLAVAAMHEVFTDAGRQSAAATGFVAGLARRVAARRPLVWVRQDFTEIESGALSMSGLAELGLDPRLLVTVRAADVDTALRTAADALACDALGAVVLEVWGKRGSSISSPAAS